MNVDDIKKRKLAAWRYKTNTINIEGKIRNGFGHFAKRIQKGFMLSLI